MFLALTDNENDCQLTASNEDTNGFAKIPKLIEANEVPMMDTNILVKWAQIAWKSNGFDVEIVLFRKKVQSFLGEDGM